MSGILDARGVVITAGDIVIYGFGVGRSIAMAEGVVVAEKEGYPYPAQTPTGRIKVRIVRRSYTSGEKPVVDVAPDRLVVLKRIPNARADGESFLPKSPLPRQDEIARRKFEADIAYRLEEIERVGSGGELREWWHGDRGACLEHHRRLLARAKKGLEGLG